MEKKRNFIFTMYVIIRNATKRWASQAISYTTGVPAMIGAMMIMNGTWNKAGVYNIEEFDPDPFMEALNKYGLPWKISEDPELID